MNDKVDWRFLFSDARARLYLLWAGVSLVGFVVAHFSKSDLGINGFWVILSAVGLVSMYRVMPMRMKQARRILIAWLIPILIGMIISFAVFYAPAGFSLIPYLAGFWLAVVATGFVWNGIYDAPSGWYYAAAIQCSIAAAAIGLSADMREVQWLIAAIVSTWGMLNLWLFRSESL